MRKFPNIVITGTPGVGKTTTATQLIELADTENASSSTTTTTTKIPLKHISINKIAKQHNFYESYDSDLQTYVIDEEKLLDHVEDLINNGDGEGGWVIDWHVCDIFPERWVDLVVVLRCEDTKVFYERLTTSKNADGETRGYEGKKLDENVDAEIFGTIAEEAREAWPEEGRVVELRSVEAEDVEGNCERIWEWVKQWVKDNAERRQDDGEDVDGIGD